jgi:hypothetical protein
MSGYDKNGKSWGRKIKVDPSDPFGIGVKMKNGSRNEVRINPAGLMAALSGDIANAAVMSTLGGIERQEAEGQRALVSGPARLPKTFQMFSLPDSKENMLAAIGIKLLGEADELFNFVELPEGWQIKATEHNMHSELLDNLGRKRGGIFYKAAFYDQRADFNFCTRFSVRTEPEDAYKSGATYEERRCMKTYGRVYDCETCIFQSNGAEPTKDYNLEDRLKKEELAQCLEWIKEHGLEDYQNYAAYWDLPPFEAIK